jgi:GNAT superfamily N-acetyltransferase
MRIPGIRESLRWRGPWIVCLLSLRELLRPLFYWYVWHIYESDLVREFPQPYSRSILDVVIYTSQDDLSSIKPRIVAMGELSTLEIETRFHRGDAIAFASSSGEPVGYIWMAFSCGIELEFDTYWIIRTGEALRYGAFVVPSFRGRGIYSILNSALNKYALERGVTRTLGSISVLNTQSLSLPKHYNRRISMTVFVVRTRLLSLTFRKSFRAPLHSRFSWPRHPSAVAEQPLAPDESRSRTSDF